MHIAILGSGDVGKALGGSLIRAGHTVTLSASGPRNAAAAAALTGAQAASSNLEAVRSADVVILAVPYRTVDAVVSEIREAVTGRILVDATNRVDADDPGRVLDGGSAAEQIQAQAPGARVVKAFNTSFAARLADPAIDGVTLDAFIAGDDNDANKTIGELARSVGFRPIDAGPLAMSRALEAMALLNITLQMRNNWPWQAGFNLVGPTP